MEMPVSYPPLTLMRWLGVIFAALLFCSTRLLADFISLPMPLPPKNGDVVERGKVGTQVTIQWTGKIPPKGGKPDLLGFEPIDTILPERDPLDPFGTVSFHVPEKSTNSDTHRTAPVMDYIQYSKDPGPVSVLMLEAFLPSGTDFVQYPFLDYIDSVVGPFVTIWVPDLYSSNDPDSDAILYEAVNLSVYMASLPTFSLGDTFDIVNGTVPSLPGMIFGNSEVTFDPNSSNGLDNPSPYTGPGYALSEHGNVVTPEPGSLILMATVMMMLGIKSWCLRRTPGSWRRAGDL